MQFDQRSFEKANLILKYLRDELSLREREKLCNWMQEDERNRRLVKSLIRESGIRREHRFNASINLQKGWESVLKKIQRKQGK